MNTERLFAHFDRVAEAPEAIPRLRRFVLDLAVRGKLVEQDLSDEPAPELLTRIATQKATLASLGQARQGKAPLSDGDGPSPFRIPGNWCWTDLSNVGLLSPRNSADDATQASFIPMPLIPSEYGVRHQQELRSWGEIKTGYTHFAEGDVAVAKITPCFENGKSTVLRGLSAGIGAGTTELHVMRPLLVSPDFILLFLKSPYFIGSGIPRMTGTAGQKRLPFDYFAHAPLPLPPLAEQHRIVAKVDELMALCDRLQAAQAEREARRDRLAAASLHRLNQPTDRAGHAAFRDHASFYLNLLPRLTVRPEQISALRQAILNLAVRGRLVPQNPNDVTPTTSPYLAPNPTAPFPVPASWVWARVGDVAQSRLGKMLDQAKNKGTPRRYLRNVNVRWRDFDLSDLAMMPFEDTELAEFALRPGDVLICEGGEPGRAAVWDGRQQDIYFQKAIHRARLPEWISPEFFVHVIRESANSGRLATYFTGVGIKHFTGKGLASFLTPVPPLAEQYRILAKVDELLTVCDRLESRITTNREISRRLLESILHNALEPVPLTPPPAAAYPNAVELRPLRAKAEAVLT